MFSISFPILCIRVFILLLSMAMQFAISLKLVLIVSAIFVSERSLRRPQKLNIAIFGSMFNNQ